MSDETLPFFSKRDLWLTVVILGTNLLLVVVAIRMMTLLSRASAVVTILVPCVALVVVGLTTWLWLSTGYAVRGEELVARAGPFQWRVPIREIQALRLSSDPISSPALSLDRLEISYRTNGEERLLLVSPADKLAFIKALQKVNPEIALR